MLDARGPLKIRENWRAWGCSRGPMVQETGANTAWRLSLEKERSMHPKFLLFKELLKKLVSVYTNLQL